MICMRQRTMEVIKMCCLKKILIILLVNILSCCVYSNTPRYDSVIVYGLDKDVLRRIPVTKNNIDKYYDFKIEFKNLYFDIDNISHFAVSENYDKSVSLRIDFVQNNKIITLYFNNDNMVELKSKISDLLNF